MRSMFSHRTLVVYVRIESGWIRACQSGMGKRERNDDQPVTHEFGPRGREMYYVEMPTPAVDDYGRGRYSFMVMGRRGTKCIRHAVFQLNGLCLLDSAILCSLPAVPIGSKQDVVVDECITGPVEKEEARRTIKFYDPRIFLFRLLSQ